MPLKTPRLPDLSAYTTANGRAYHETIGGTDAVSLNMLAQRVTPATGGAANVAFSQALPAFSRPIAVFHRVVSAPGALTTGTHVGVGDASDADRLSEEAIATLDGVGEQVMKTPDVGNAIITASVTPLWATLNGSGAAAGNFNSTTPGTWDIWIIYEQYGTLTATVQA